MVENAMIWTNSVMRLNLINYNIILDRDQLKIKRKTLQLCWLYDFLFAILYVRLFLLSHGVFIPFPLSLIFILGDFQFGPAFFSAFKLSLSLSLLMLILMVKCLHVNFPIKFDCYRKWWPQFRMKSTKPYTFRTCTLACTKWFQINPVIESRR